MLKHPLIIGHRGAAAHLPENTLESFDLAFNKMKADMIEFDVHFTRDKIPVILHDARLDRTTNGTGYIQHKNLKEIKILDAGYCFDPKKNGSFPHRGQGIRIPTLEEVMERFSKRLLCIEIKENSAEITRAVMSLVKRFKIESGVIVGSKHDNVAKTLQKEFPNISRFLSQPQILSAIVDFKKRSKENKPDSKAVASLPTRKFNFALDSQEMIDFLKKRQMRIFFWTINDPKQMKLLAERGVDGIITDDPELARRQFETAPKIV